MVAINLVNKLYIQKSCTVFSTVLFTMASYSTVLICTSINSNEYKMLVVSLEIYYWLILALCKLHIQACLAKLNFQAG